jgi:hypothetical protein
MKTIQIKSLDDLDKAMWAIREEFDAHGPCEIVIHKEGSEADKKRTLTQNASLHKYCSNISEKMNDAGFTQRQLIGSFKEGFELPVTPVMIKDIFREVGNALYHKDSTTKLTTVEIQKVYQVVDQRFGEITGIRGEWPSVESQSVKSLLKEK